jgi:hypothetical protein
LTIDSRIIVYGFDLPGVGDLIDIEKTRDAVSLQLILLIALLWIQTRYF